MKDFLKDQLEGFIDTHNGIVSDMKDIIMNIKLKDLAIHLTVLMFLIILYVANLLLYSGSIIVVGSMVMFKYIKGIVGRILNGK